MRGRQKAGERMTLYLGIDPGHPSGWALVEQPSHGRPVLLRMGETSGPTYLPTVCDLGYSTPCTACIEGQFPHPGGGKGGDHRAQAWDTIACAQSAGGWREACIGLGWEVLPFVQPNVWRKAVYGTRGAFRWSPLLTSEENKTLAILTVRALFGVVIPKSKHHTAEAVMIATYAARLRTPERAEA